MATDAASREVFDQLQERLRISRKRFDEWANRQSSLIQRSVEEHTRQIGNSKGMFWWRYEHQRANSAFAPSIPSW